MLARAVGVVLALDVLAAVIYGVYALAPRRAIFTALANDPSDVTRAAAERSDTTNLVLFLVAGLLTLAAIVLIAVWMARLRTVERRAPANFGTPWWLATAIALLTILVALVMHASSDPGRIAVGYVVLGLGALLVAAAAAWALYGVQQTARIASSGAPAGR